MKMAHSKPVVVGFLIKQIAREMIVNEKYLSF